jgi:hypothetical protein
MLQGTKKIVCPDCGDAVEADGLDRRDFLRSVTASAAALATAGTGLWAVPTASAAPTAKSKSETLVKTLYDTLTPDQKKVICFPWDHKDPKRGLLRTHVSNNWHITPKTIDDSRFYTPEQKAICRDIYKNLFNPDWVEKFDKQLKDDNKGRAWGADQNVAIFGTPGDDKFMLVMTGRHMTVRADGNHEAHMALGGPIFHGHDPEGLFNERVGHPGNIFWHQAQLANKVYQILDGKQQEKALAPRRPAESAVAFRGPDGKFPGFPCSDMSRDQKEALQKVLLSLVEPYRQEDQDEVMECLKKLGGLDKCSLAFYKDGDLGDDGEWDNWRLEGPAFVWYFRGHPHVHIWINVGADPSVPLNARG